MAKTVLVVDDSPTMRAVIELTLRKLSDVRVVHAEDGVKALEKIKVETPALILTDITMPNMDGYELIERIRVTNGDKTTPIVFITTKGNDADRERGFALGANAYVPKPINGVQLIETIEPLLNRNP